MGSVGTGSPGLSITAGSSRPRTLQQEANLMAIFKRGRVYWYKFRWSIKTADAKKESYLIRRSAKTSAKRKAEQQEEDHRTALRRGEVHPLDPFPKVEAPAL